MQGEERIEDPFRAIEDVFLPDKRYVTDQVKIEDVHRAIAPIVLVDSVPASVRQLFETAKNVSLYAWFAYRFHQVSEMVAYSALEMALKTRFAKENLGCNPKKVPKGLKQLLKHAQKEGWIENSRFTFIRALARHRLLDKQRYEIIQSGVLKNPGDSVELLEPTDEDIEREMPNIDFVASIVEYQPQIRNDLVHGSTRMDPFSVSMLSRVAEIINQVYS